MYIVLVSLYTNSALRNKNVKFSVLCGIRLYNTCHGYYSNVCSLYIVHSMYKGKILQKCVYINNKEFLVSVIYKVIMYSWLCDLQLSRGLEVIHTIMYIIYNSCSKLSQQRHTFKICN